MGSTESKMAACAPVKAEPSVRPGRVGQLMDPRSPSAAIDRTPIQVSSWTPSIFHREGCLQGFSWDRLVILLESHSWTGSFSSGTRRLFISGFTIPNFFYRLVVLCPKLLLSRRPRVRWLSQILVLPQLALAEPPSERS